MQQKCRLGTRPAVHAYNPAYAVVQNGHVTRPAFMPKTRHVDQQRKHIYQD